MPQYVIGQVQGSASPVDPSLGISHMRTTSTMHHHTTSLWALLHIYPIRHRQHSCIYTPPMRP